MPATIDPSLPAAATAKASPAPPAVKTRQPAFATTLAKARQSATDKKAAEAKPAKAGMKEVRHRKPRSVAAKAGAKKPKPTTDEPGDDHDPHAAKDKEHTGRPEEHFEHDKARKPATALESKPEAADLHSRNNPTQATKLNPSPADQTAALMADGSNAKKSTSPDVRKTDAAAAGQAAASSAQVLGATPPPQQPPPLPQATAPAQTTPAMSQVVGTTGGLSNAPGLAAEQPGLRREANPSGATLPATNGLPPAAPAANPDGIAAVAAADAAPAPAKSVAAAPQSPPAEAALPKPTVAAAAPAVVHAAPAPPPAPPEAAFAEANHSRIVTGVRGQLLPNGGSMSIRLDPPALGDLQVTVRMRDGVMSASFQTSNDQATKLLSHSLGQLKTVLESAGLSVEKLHVTQTSPSTSHQGGDPSEHKQDQPVDEQASREQQRREMLRRMWRKVSGGDPLDLVA